MPLVQSFQKQAARGRMCDVEEGYYSPAMALQPAFLFPLDSHGGHIFHLSIYLQECLFQLSLYQTWDTLLIKLQTKMF